MNLPQWSKGLIIFLLCGAAFFAGAYWQTSLNSKPNTDPCTAGAQSQSYQLLNSLLREFDDAAILAINLPREQVVEQVEAMQSIRRETERLPVPGCLSNLKVRMVDYMNKVVDLLVAFVGGVPPDLVLQALEGTSTLRDDMELEMAKVIGATVTPYPTPFQFAIPVTGSGQEQQVATTAPTETAVMAIVTNDTGANLRAEPNADSGLIAALLPNTQVEVLGVSADRLWVHVTDADGVSGWLYVPLVSLDGDIEALPVIE